VVVVVAPPATLPAADPDASAGSRREAFTAALGEARAAGRLLHGLADLAVEGA